jgi:RING-box protein 1
MSSKFVINDIKILSSWGFNLPSNTDCTICRNNLNTKSLYNQDNISEHVILRGSCGHSFHNDCINPWVSKHKTCPICFADWSSSIHKYKCT